MFRRLPEAAGETIAFTINGERAQALAGDTVAAALLAGGIAYCRTTPVSGAKRAPYCMMGVCFECLAEIDGAPNRQSCMIAARPGMRIRRQRGPRPIEPE